MISGQSASVEEFLSWPEEKPYLELVHGTVQPKSTPDNLHAYLQSELARRLGNWGHDHGFTLTEQRCILQADGRQHVILPDVAWFSFTRLPALIDGPVRSAPTLAIEIVSKDDRYSAVEDNVMLYLAGGVDLVWVVDPRARNVKSYRPDRPPRRLASPDVLADSEAVPGFSVPLGELFEQLPIPPQPPASDG